MLPKGPYQPQLTESEILKFWLDNKFYAPEYHSDKEFSTANKDNRETFTIILPPPNANGNLHLGHMSGYAYQDLMGRFARMQGKKVLLLPGKDHAGIQTEVVFERELEKQGKSKRDLGREEFYRLCYEFCMKQAENARSQEQKIGLSADFDRELFTLDPKIVAEVMKAFELMYKDGLVYRDKRIINWCPRCQSALADIDTEFKDEPKNKFFYFKYAFTEPDQLAIDYKNKYKDSLIQVEVETLLQDKNLTGREELKRTFKENPELGEYIDETPNFYRGFVPKEINPNSGRELDVFILGYENLDHGVQIKVKIIGIKMDIGGNYTLVGINPESNPSKKDLDGFKQFILSKTTAGGHFISFSEYPDNKYYVNGFIVATVRPETIFGDTALAVNPEDRRYKEIIGKSFEIMSLNGPTSIKIISDNAVEMIQNDQLTGKFRGTGMLKVTPAHSMEDWDIAQRHKKEAMPEKQVINFDGKLNHLTGKYEGMTVKEARKAMITDMKETGMLVYLDENYQNRIRICERCKHPIEPLISYQWFVDTKPLKAEAKRLVEQGFTKIMPEGKKKTYMQWMDTEEDWCITRQLWWGYRLPVWYKGEREQYITETGEVKEKIADKVIEKIEDYEGLLSVGINPPDQEKVFLIPGKYGYMLRKIYPELENKYSFTQSIHVDNIANPNYEDYKKAFRDLNFKNQIAVGHSLGTKALMKYIVEEEIRLKQLILIASAPKLREKDINAPYAPIFDKLDYQKLSSLVDKITFIYSDNDDLVNLDDFKKEYQDNIPTAEFILEPGLGHYATSDNDEPSPALVKILDELSSKNTIQLTVIRHAESEHNRSGVYAGKFDADLSEKGRAAAEALAKDFTGDFDVIITSPLKRTKQTTEILNKNWKLKLETNDLLVERDYGNLEGLTWEEFEQKFPEEAAKNFEHYQPALDKGETIAQVEARVDRFLAWLKQSGYKKPLIVTSAGVIRILERKLSKLTPEQSRKLALDNLSVRNYQLAVGSEASTTSQWQQDEDVLDTWFSSGQWPFVTLMAKAGDYDNFYPTQVMETGWDILLFWVTRMMLLNPYRAKKLNPENPDEKTVPFKDVYLHGLVLDKNGVKMSKSKGNGIDPFEMMQKYGTDALRFSFVKGNSVGQNYRLYEEKIAANRNFCNKIWNASKFVLFNIEDNSDRILSLNREDLKLTEEDKTFLEHTDELVKETTRRLTEFQFGVAAEELYESFWHQFADVYLEQIKNRLYTKDREGNPINTSPEEQQSRLAAQWVLLYSLEVYLKLLHPFIPFITENIWQSLPKKEQEAETIMYSHWPQV